MKSVVHDVTCTPKYYIAGPMRGFKAFNFPAFFGAAEHLRAIGAEVFSPAERDLEFYKENGIDVMEQEGTNEELAAMDFDLREAFASDTEFICRKATHIYMLPGWSRSTGATAERALAIALGLTGEGAPA